MGSPRQLRELLEGLAREPPLIDWVEILAGEERPQPAIVDTPGPKLYQNVSSIKHRTNPLCCR